MSGAGGMWEALGGGKAMAGQLPRGRGKFGQRNIAGSWLSDVASFDGGGVWCECGRGERDGPAPAVAA